MLKQQTKRVITTLELYGSNAVLSVDELYSVTDYYEIYGIILLTFFTISSAYDGAAALVAERAHRPMRAHHERLAMITRPCR